MKYLFAKFDEFYKKKIDIQFQLTKAEAEKLRDELSALYKITNDNNKVYDSEIIKSLRIERVDACQATLIDGIICTGSDLKGMVAWECSYQIENKETKLRDAVKFNIIQDAALIISLKSNNMSVTDQPHLMAIKDSKAHKNLIKKIKNIMPFPFIEKVLQICLFEIFNPSLKLIAAKFINQGNIPKNIPMEIEAFLENIKRVYDHSAPDIEHVDQRESSAYLRCNV